MKFLRWLVLALVAGIAAGASAALQSSELLKFSLVPALFAYMLIVLAGLSAGLLVQGVQEGLRLALSITLVGAITLFLALYLPNREVVAAAPELILRSVWWGALTIFVLTLIGIIVARIFSGE
ncbi:MAG: hypothetical protein K6T71_05190 [Candidatus Bipolaricaulota bacterium]|nr:hypothetical protein [Candidatus Bipolaricaulota bacterium]